jgi:hypothetical protein
MAAPGVLVLEVSLLRVLQALDLLAVRTLFADAEREQECAEGCGDEGESPMPMT